MEVVPFQKEMIPAAADLFVRNFKDLRQAVPVLPDQMEDPGQVGELLEWLAGRYPVVAALEDGVLAGYMGAIVVDGFRDTERRGAYCPEWGHAAREGSLPNAYHALYPAASAQWAEAGCQVHAVTNLAHQRTLLETWFWYGFGLSVVDAARPVEPSGASAPRGYRVRPAGLNDVELLTILEAEHWKHYAQPPIFMAANWASSAEELAELLSEPASSFWLAMQGNEALGFLRFESKSHGAVRIVESDVTIAITGAYVRPQHRGRGVATALLDAALQDYAARGFRCCSVDFESFNPYASRFWRKYFEPVALSVVRVLERP